MDIIYHTADVDKNRQTLENLFTSGVPVELDFVMSKDGVPIWTHSLLPTQLLSSTSPKLEGSIDLYDVLDINNHRCHLMLDMKYIPRNILKSNEFSRILKLLEEYGEIQIESLDFTFLQKLAENYNFEIGIIVNVLNRILINRGKNFVPNVDFFALSSELWEQNNGIYITKCRDLYPKAKMYAWTWARREEDEERIGNFIDMDADGIITGKPALVKTIFDNKKNRG